MVSEGSSSRPAQDGLQRDVEDRWHLLPEFVGALHRPSASLPSRAGEDLALLCLDTSAELSQSRSYERGSWHRDTNGAIGRYEGRGSWPYY